jgi:hypothetical protein
MAGANFVFQAKTHHFQCLVNHSAFMGRDVEPENSNQTISAFRNEGTANADNGGFFDICI